MIEIASLPMPARGLDGLEDPAVEADEVTARPERDPIQIYGCWTGVVHIADRLLREIDGPMLKTGLQGFHGAPIARPRRPEDRPDPARLETRFERFLRAAA